MKKSLYKDFYQSVTPSTDNSTKDQNTATENPFMDNQNIVQKRNLV